MPASAGSSNRLPHRRLNPSTPLGPQCVRCRKRRVKCDSARPGCERCECDGIECPGYGTRAATWNVKTQASMAIEQGAELSGASNGVVSVVRQSKSILRASSEDFPSPSSSESLAGSGPQNNVLAWLGERQRSSLESPDSGPGTSHLISTNASSRKTAPAPVLSHLWAPLLPLLTNIRPMSPSMPAQDCDAFLFFDCLMYYNKCLRPLLIGCLLPNQSRVFEISEWAAVPPLMKHNTVYAMTAQRIARGEDHSDLQMQLHVYRGRTMELLRQALALIGRTAWGALVLIVMFLGGELGISTVEGGWETHYDAAWAVLEMQGHEGGVDEGIKTCWTLGEEPQLACVYLLQIEIFSGTTAPVWTLASARDRRVLHNLQRDDLEDIDDRFLASTCPCPLQIAVVVAEVNELRSALYALRITKAPSVPGQEGSVWSTRLWHVLTQLLCFQAELWVSRILCKNEAQVNAAEAEGGFDRKAMTHSWTVLANCYRSAAIVYLIRSCSSWRLSEALPDECKGFFNDAENILHDHHETLSEGLRFLLQDFRSSQRGRKRPVLWRFLFWPLFVEAYEAIGWPWAATHRGRHERELTAAEKNHQNALIDRHRRLGKELGANCLFDAANLLQEVQKQREIQQVWDWDDAFPRRVVFAL